MNGVLQTERLLLRRLTEDDWEDLCEILQDAETMYAYEHAFSEREARAWLENQLARYARDGLGLWAVTDRDTGDFLGQAGLTWQDAGGSRELEIGYLFKRRHWHNGYAAEAACGCRDYAFGTLNHPRVVSMIRTNNYASQRVAQRVGMRRERQFIKRYYGMDMLHYVYAVQRAR